MLLIPTYACLMSQANLRATFERADATDRAEGLCAYQRYHDLMVSIAAEYNFALDRVIAAFVSLSPNSDCVGNLRSLISVCAGVQTGLPAAQIKTSGYNHCRDRAYLYLTGTRDFLASTRGLKIINFYHNLLDPFDGRWVTVDGHVSAAWRGLDLTMKEALIRGAGEYQLIADSLKALAFAEFLLPCQYQAVLWFARKRVLGIKYDPQLDLFSLGDAWRVSRLVSDLRPY